MLEKLDEIDWSQLHHAYGSAADVPGLIRALLSEEHETRWNAISELFNTIWHQGTVYEASAYAVPFLQDLLGSPDTKDKPMIADLLAAMADGTASLEGASQDGKLEKIYREILTKNGRDFDQELTDGRRYVVATREAVGRGLSSLYPYLTCDELGIRYSVASALKYYPEQSALTLPLLKDALLSEGDEQVREKIREAINILEGERRP